MVFLEIPNVPLGTVFAETVTYYTVEVAVTLTKIGVINTSQCHIRITPHFICSIEQVNFVTFSYDIATMENYFSEVGDG